MQGKRMRRMGHDRPITVDDLVPGFELFDRDGERVHIEEVSDNVIYYSYKFTDGDGVRRTTNPLSRTDADKSFRLSECRRIGEQESGLLISGTKIATETAGRSAQCCPHCNSTNILPPYHGLGLDVAPAKCGDCGDEI